MTRKALLFCAHKLPRGAAREFRRLSDATSPPDTCQVLWDRTGNERFGRRVARLPRHEFDIERLAGLGYPPLVPNRLTPGSVHFALIDFAKTHPHDAYWLIEYDIRFTGNWRVLFDHFEDAPADLITCYVVRRRDNPGWHWWSSLRHPSEVVPEAERLRSFNPIMRISHPALMYLDEMHQAGWVGHHEVLVPTLLERGGFTLRDFGGIGEYVAPSDRNRFYFDPGPLDGDPERALGSIRWRPRYRSLMFRARNRLYHPVK